jgi:hypothetical protein
MLVASLGSMDDAQRGLRLDRCGIARIGDVGEHRVDRCAEQRVPELVTAARTATAQPQALATH